MTLPTNKPVAHLTRRRGTPIHSIQGRLPALASVCLACLGLAACAASSTDGALTPAAATTSPIAAGPATYTLTTEEQSLDCKKLTGRAQIRILQIRDYQMQTRASATARSLHAMTAPAIKGSLEGADPDARYARDRAMIEAYNAELKRRGCPAFNLEDELTPKPGPAAPLPAAKK